MKAVGRRRREEEERRRTTRGGEEGRSAASFAPRRSAAEEVARWTREQTQKTRYLFSRQSGFSFVDCSIWST